MWMNKQQSRRSTFWITSTEHFQWTITHTQSWTMIRKRWWKHDLIDLARPSESYLYLQIVCTPISLCVIDSFFWWFNHFYWQGRYRYCKYSSYSPSGSKTRLLWISEEGVEVFGPPTSQFRSFLLGLACKELKYLDLPGSFVHLEQVKILFHSAHNS